MSLSSLTVKNFQCHRHLKIDFSPTVTTIVGPNDSGKSAIVRALHFVVLNKYRGKEFIRHDQDSNHVTLEILKGKKKQVVKRSGGKKNSYKLGGKVYHAFSSKVPPEITSVLQLGEVNFQKQHDSSFWFCLSAGQVARELNALVDLEAIDKVQQELNKRTRLAKTRLQVCQERIHELKGRIRQLHCVPSLHDLLRGLLTLDTDISLESQQITSLRRIQNEALFALSAIRNAKQVTAGWLPVTSAASDYLADKDQFLNARRLLYTASALESRSKGSVPSLNEAGQHQKQYATLSVELVTLKSWYDQARNLTKEVTRCTQAINQKEQLLEKELGGRCPQCGGILTSTSLV